MSDRPAYWRRHAVPRTRIEHLANEQTSVTADTVLRLAKAFATRRGVWPNLQTAYDMRTAKARIGGDLAKIKPVIEKAA
ncbi:HigA family addiction module antitoxin [Rhodopseudomonas palustris]|uniref:HigA family addiction module antitoxin n=1 Tax=Rhodopseudomonas palustris TaxID=1076 RepID=UPI0034E933CD